MVIQSINGDFSIALDQADVSDAFQTSQTKREKVFRRLNRSKKRPGATNDVEFLVDGGCDTSLFGHLFLVEEK